MPCPKVKEASEIRLLGLFGSSIVFAGKNIPTFLPLTGQTGLLVAKLNCGESHDTELLAF